MRWGAAHPSLLHSDILMTMYAGPEAHARCHTIVAPVTLDRVSLCACESVPEATSSGHSDAHTASEGARKVWHASVRHDCRHRIDTARKDTELGLVSPPGNLRYEIVQLTAERPLGTTWSAEAHEDEDEAEAERRRPKPVVARGRCATQPLRRHSPLRLGRG
mmetsp:Transcript_6562/g.16110  ORF Transcript_6562/g.16110 Transcript_6562/m.16110 type:complete len:162 (-) Transcript_6562:2056-2541(-)